jgi:hypothetical protein
LDILGIGDKDVKMFIRGFSSDFALKQAQQSLDDLAVLAEVM